MINRRAKYYSEVGSYRGVIRTGKGRKWVSVFDLNRINKSDWIRWQGPPSEAIIRAMKEKPIRADILYPERKNYEM